jgi:hypothetical protein
VHVVRHERTEHGTTDGGRDGHRPPATPVAIDQRPEQRRDDDERRQGQDEVEEDLALRLARRDREEQGAGQGDRDERAATQHEHLYERQPTERPALVEEVTEGLAGQGAELIHPIADGH